LAAEIALPAVAASSSATAEPETSMSAVAASASTPTSLLPRAIPVTALSVRVVRSIA